MSNVATMAKHRSVAWTRMRALSVVMVGSVGLIAATSGAGSQIGGGVAAQYIVQGVNSNVAAADVRADHGVVLTALPIVRGVVAKLTPGEVAAATEAGLQVSPNLQVTVEGFGNIQLPAGYDPSSNFGAVTGANSMWANGINGAGVAVAVLDTGIDANLPDLRGRVIDGVNLSAQWQQGSWNTDQYGHGTFVAGIIASNGAASNGQYTGVAPDANLVSIKVAGSTGITTESIVIQGVAWAVAHQVADSIRVLNMSLGVEPSSPTALDPLDQAVEQAWDAGIVVVTSAGNAGPGNGSITSPGNDPLVITAGTINDLGANIAANFTVPTYSSVGPTLFDGWFKPDLVAPGESIVSLAVPGSTVYNTNPLAKVGSAYFVGSGTSFSAAIVSGLAALLLQQNPSLTPDQVKAALLMSASSGPVGNPFVDGHGIANVSAAAAIAGQVFLNQAPAEAAETTSPPATVSLATTWAAGTWNPANWSGAVASAASLSSTNQGLLGSTVTGITWSGAAWNGAAWNGAAWNGAAWNGAAWNGAAWNGAAWNGAAWNNATWNAAAWNGDSWR
jgi:serine protease AprX